MTQPGFEPTTSGHKVDTLPMEPLCRFTSENIPLHICTHILDSQACEVSLDAQNDFSFHWVHIRRYFFSCWSSCRSSSINDDTSKQFGNLGPVVQNLTKLLAKMMLKFLSWNMANTLIFFAEKMWVAFTFLQQKYQCIWKYLSYNS